MRILWLTPELPYWPGGSGGSTRQHMLIRELVARGHAVDVVAPVAREQRAGVEALRATGATLYEVLRPASRVSEVIDAVRARPALALDVLRMPLLAWQVDVFWAALRGRMEEAVAAHRPDVVVVDHDWAARWQRDLPAGIPRVLDLPDLSWLYYRQRARAAEGVRARALAIEGRRWARFDRRLLARHDALLTMSADDDRDVQELSDRPHFPVPNGVDTSALVATPLPPEPVALFTGTFKYPPNAEALEWLLRDLWPRVTAQVPEARLLVVGRGVPDELAALATPSVEIAGFVPEMQPWFDRARVVLVPMRSGAGTRLKVLDALASGRAMVSTTMGAAGVPIDDGTQALIADDADAFAATTARALTEPGLAERIGAAGRKLAEDVYDWGVIGAELERVLVAVVARGPLG